MAQMRIHLDAVWDTSPKIRKMFMLNMLGHDYEDQGSRGNGGIRRFRNTIDGMSTTTLPDCQCRGSGSVRSFWEKRARLQSMPMGASRGLAIACLLSFVLLSTPFYALSIR